MMTHITRSNVVRTASIHITQMAVRMGDEGIVFHVGNIDFSRSTSASSIKRVVMRSNIHIDNAIDNARVIYTLLSDTYDSLATFCYRNKEALDNASDTSFEAFSDHLAVYIDETRADIERLHQLKTQNDYRDSLKRIVSKLYQTNQLVETVNDFLERGTRMYE